MTHSHTQNLLMTVDSITQQLRVPEFSYLIEQNDDLSAEIEGFLSELCQKSGPALNGSVLNEIKEYFGKRALPVRFINMAFLVDRFFDVWGRKNKLSSEINSILSLWRLPFFRFLYSCKEPESLTGFITLLDRLTNDNLGWMPQPERSRKILLNALEELTDPLNKSKQINTLLLNELADRWQSFDSKQGEKFHKVVQRLVVAEAELSWKLFSRQFANAWLNKSFKKYSVPESLITFLSDYWVNVIALSIVKENHPQISEHCQALTQTLKNVFCRKGNAAFNYADNLLDDLQAECLNYGENVPDLVWQNLEADIVSILQNKSVAEQIFETVETDEINRFELEQEQLAKIGDWYYSVDKSNELKQKIVAVFNESQEILFCNYLGMKTTRCSFNRFEADIKLGNLKKLSVDASFSEVIQKTASGLLKVSATQKKARLLAAEKARKEAEILLAEKRKSEQQAALKAEEIAQRTKNILKKREDKQRLDKENEIYKNIAECKLGAWISVKEQDAPESAAPLRYKLVVKLAAKGKFIFVDKLGVKKIEYSELMLMQGIQSNHIEIISDGAEFEESLERVVSRLRSPR